MAKFVDFVFQRVKDDNTREVAEVRQVRVQQAGTVFTQYVVPYAQGDTAARTAILELLKSDDGPWLSRRAEKALGRQPDEYDYLLGDVWVPDRPSEFVEFHETMDPEIKIHRQVVMMLGSFAGDQSFWDSLAGFIGKHKKLAPPVV